MLLPLWTACDKDIHENDRHGLAVGMEWLEGIEPTDITSPGKPVDIRCGGA